MSKYIDVDRLKAEIDKQYTEYRTKMKTDDFTYYEGMADALGLFEQFLDSLPEQPDSEEKFRNLLDAMGDCGFSQDNILLLKSIWEDAGCQIPQREQPVEGLEEEMEKFFETMPVLEHENIFEDTFQNIARHFAEWGAEHLKK